MSLETVVALVGFVLLLLALVPLLGWQAVVFRWLHRLLHLLLVFTVIVCALSHLRPEFVPNRVVLLLNAAVERMRAEMPALAVAEGLLGSPWLVVALVAVVVGLPQLRGLRESLRRCTHRPHDQVDSDLSRPRPGTTSVALPDSQHETPRLLKDFLEDSVFPY
jgi:hypothetical protein